MRDESVTGAGPAIEVARHRRRRARSWRTGSHGRRWSLRVRDWRVRAKLGAVLAIPAVAFVVVAALQAGLSMRQAATLDAFAAQVAVADTVTDLAHELQFERDWVAGQLAAAVASPAEGGRGRGQLTESVSAAREAVAVARRAFDRAVEPLRENPGLRGAVAEAVSALDGLSTVHAGLEQGWLREEAVFDGYTRAIEATLALLPTPLAVEDAEVGGYRELAEVKELTARNRGQMHALISAGGLRPGESERLADLRAQRRAALDRFRLAASPAQLNRFDEAVRGQAVRATARLEQEALEQAGSTSAAVTPQQWWQAATTELELYREVEVELLTEVDTRVEQASRDRWRQTVAVSGAALLTLVVSLLLSVGIGRSMVRSLRMLRRQAVEVAQKGLPGLLERLRTVRASDPITAPVVTATAAGADEVGEVGEAFTQVHRSAVELAVEQAQMRRNVNRIFVNLARRSQVLVERQLAVLDKLERVEESPTQLADLFRLDHLATRMRRNNDSLLVLTGADPTRRYDQPIALASVAQGALAEIERYQRVRDDVAGDLYVVGYVVFDLAHLLAELLDNATAFSEPESAVMLTGQRVYAPAGALVEVTDAGIGMSAAALRDANQMLSEPPVIDVATSQRMGLVVIGQIAARHGLRVHLDSAEPGIRASVWLPERLLAVPSEPAETPPLDVAGEIRPPVLRRPRITPARAEDVLGQAQAVDVDDSVWWSRPSGADAGSGEAKQPTAPAAVAASRAVAHRVSAAGLPIRVPMAQVPPSTGLPAEGAPLPVVPDLDPEELGGTLSAFYGGVHKAEAEEIDHDAPTRETDFVPGGP